MDVEYEAEVVNVISTVPVSSLKALQRQITENTRGKAEFWDILTMTVAEVMVLTKKSFSGHERRCRQFPGSSSAERAGL